MVKTRSGTDVSPSASAGEVAGGPRSPRTPLAGMEQRQAGTATSGRTPGRAGRTGVSASAAYSLLAASFVALAVPCFLVPKHVARMAFGRAADPPEDQHSHLLSLLGCGLLSAATAALGLEECARKHQLRTFTADTLKAALVAFACGNILLQLYYPATLTPLAAIVVAGTSAAALALPASQLLGREEFGRVQRDFRRLPRNLHYLLTLRKPSITGALYLLLTWMFPMAGLAYFIAPKYTLYHTFGYVYGKSTQLLWKAVGGGLMTALPAITYTLKDKAENGLLGRSLARTLNTGLMLASVGHLFVFGPILAKRHGGFLLPFLTSTWLTSLLTAMAGLSAPEAGALMEDLGARAAGEGAGAKEAFQAGAAEVAAAAGEEKEE